MRHRALLYCIITMLFFVRFVWFCFVLLKGIHFVVHTPFLAGSRHRVRVTKPAKKRDGMSSTHTCLLHTIYSVASFTTNVICKSTVVTLSPVLEGLD